MKHTFKVILLVLCMLFITYKIRADHAAGGNITYTCIAPNTYEVVLSFYRDCAGINAPGADSTRPLPKLYISSVTCDTTIVDTLSLIDSLEVSDLCPAELPNSSCNGGILPGIRKFTYKDTITLPGQCDDWYLDFSECCLNHDIVNISIYYELFVYSLINNTNGICNSSPVFTAKPIPYVCLNQPVTYDLGVVETDGDSLVYKFQSAMSVVGPIPYWSPWTPTDPITGIILDQNTGQLTFTPNTLGTFVVVIRIEEYNSSGELLGYVLHDFQVVVYDCPGTYAGPDVAICDSQSTQLSVNGGNAFVWRAIFGDSIIVGTNFSCDTCANPIASPGMTTVYEVTSDIDTACYGNKNKDTVIVTVITDIFNASITTPDSTTFCVNDTSLFTLTSVDTGGIWSGTGIIDPNNGIFRASTAGQGTHTITYSLAASCGDTFSIDLIVSSLPDATIIPAFFCITDSANALTAVNPGGIWSGTGITDTTNGIFDPATAGVGTHAITYTFTDSNSCVDIDTAVIAVNALPNPVIITVPPNGENFYDKLYFLDTTEQLQATPAGGSWFGGAWITSSGLFNPYAYVQGDTTFTVYYTITDTNGCADTTSKNFKVIDDFYLDVPTAFTPNGDNFNDGIQLKVKGYNQVEFKIFNRWGELIFETNDASIAWNGTYKEKEQPIGTYTYYVRVIEYSGEETILQGNITLIR